VNTSLTTTRLNRRWLAILALLLAAILLPPLLPAIIWQSTLGLLALVLVGCVLIALLMGWNVLDSDVTYCAAIGAFVGLVLDALNGGYFDEFGFARGILAGAVLGDVVRDQRAERLGEIPYPGGKRWWQKRAAPPKWFAKAAWSLAMVALGFTILLALSYNTQRLAAGLKGALVGDLLVDVVEARASLAPNELLRRGWAMYLLLSLAMISCTQIWYRKLSPLAVDRLLRRVAVMHCLAMLLLAFRSVLEWRQTLPGNASAEWTDGRIRALAMLVVEAQVPILTIMFTTVLLGGLLLRYLKQYGWMPALGFSALIAVGWLGLHMSYLARFVQ